MTYFERLQFVEKNNCWCSGGGVVGYAMVFFRGKKVKSSCGTGIYTLSIEQCPVEIMSEANK